MIKIKRPETTRKVLSTLVLTAGLMTTTMFANTEANYSFGDVGGGGGKSCLVLENGDCLTLNLGLNLIPVNNGNGNGSGIGAGGTVGISYQPNRRTKCVSRSQGSKTCTSTNCAGQPVQKTAANCN